MHSEVVIAVLELIGVRRFYRSRGSFVIWFATGNYMIPFNTVLLNVVTRRASEGFRRFLAYASGYQTTKLSKAELLVGRSDGLVKT